MYVYYCYMYKAVTAVEIKFLETIVRRIPLQRRRSQMKKFKEDQLTWTKNLELA